MNFPIYLLIAIITFFTSVLTIVNMVGKPVVVHFDYADIGLIIFVSLMISILWPAGLPICAVSYVGWHFIKFLSKGK